MGSFLLTFILLTLGNVAEAPPLHKGATTNIYNQRNTGIVYPASEDQLEIIDRNGLNTPESANLDYQSVKYDSLIQGYPESENTEEQLDKYYISGNGPARFADLGDQIDKYYAPGPGSFVSANTENQGDEYAPLGHGAPRPAIVGDHSETFDLNESGTSESAIAENQPEMYDPKQSFNPLSIAKKRQLDRNIPNDHDNSEFVAVKYQWNSYDHNYGLSSENAVEPQWGDYEPNGLGYPESGIVNDQLDNHYQNSPTTSEAEITENLLNSYDRAGDGTAGPVTDDSSDDSSDYSSDYSSEDSSAETSDEPQAGTSGEPFRFEVSAGPSGEIILLPVYPNRERRRMRSERMMEKIGDQITILRRLVRAKIQEEQPAYTSVQVIVLPAIGESLKKMKGIFEDAFRTIEVVSKGVRVRASEARLIIRKKRAAKLYTVTLRLSLEREFV